MAIQSTVEEGDGKPRPGHALSLDQVMGKAGLGFFHVRLLLACGLGFSAAAVEVVLSGFLFPELRKTWHLSEYALSALPTVVGVGSTIGELLWGSVADLYGRRITFMVTVGFVVVFGIASAFCRGIVSLIVMRFFVGFGYGGNIAVDFTLYSELLPTHGRGGMLFAISAFWPIGQVLTCVLAWVVIPHLGWRAFVGLCAVPSVLTCFLRPFIPESPRWLLLHGHEADAVDTCCHILKMNGMSPADAGLVEGARLVLSNEAEPLSGQHDEHKPPSSWLPQLFGKGLWRTTLAFMVFSSLLSFGGYATGTFMPSFLEMKGMASMDTYASMLMLSLAQIPGVAAAAVVGTYFGRRAPAQGSLLLLAASLVIFALVRQQWLMITASCLASACLEFCYAIYHVYVPEAFPTELRATATGVTSGIGSVMAMAVPVLTAWVVETCNAEVAVGAFAVILAIGGLTLCMLFQRETINRDLTDRVAN